MQVVDLGFRLEDIGDENTGLQREPCKPESWDKRRETLERHKAREEEIEILANQRVELNAMTAPEFLAWLEPKLALHCPRVVPSANILEVQARRIWQQREAEKRCATILQESKPKPRRPRCLRSWKLRCASWSKKSRNCRGIWRWLRS